MTPDVEERLRREIAGLPPGPQARIAQYYMTATNIPQDVAVRPHVMSRSFQLSGNNQQVYQIVTAVPFVWDRFRATGDGTESARLVRLTFEMPSEGGYILGDDDNGVSLDLLQGDRPIQAFKPLLILPGQMNRLRVDNQSADVQRVNFALHGYYLWGSGA